MREIKTVTVLGANGTMGAGSAGVIGAFGDCKVWMLARTTEKAQGGIDAAVGSVRAEVVAPNFVAGNYDDDLEKAVAESDWVFECVAESYEIKEPINKRIAAARKPGTIVSTVSSGLSIARLASHFDEDGQKFYYGTHFFNPPYKLVLCELVTHEKNDPKVTAELSEYLDKTLLRAVVETNDTPAFAGNRIGFQLMNEVAIKAEEYNDKGGIALMDAILGAYTGRAMPPLATVDLVGLDVHKAIVDNVYEETNDGCHETFKMPAFMQKLIDEGSLGNKAGKGLYKRSKTADGKRVKEYYDIKKGAYVPVPKFDLPFVKEAQTAIAGSRYEDAIDVIKNAPGEEGKLCRYFTARYISYAFSLVGEVVDNKEGVDMVMGFGFNWVPASAWVDFLGGVEATKKFLTDAGVEIPKVLADAKDSDQPFYQLQDKLDARQLFRGR